MVEEALVEKTEEFIDKFTEKTEVVGFNPEGMHPGVVNGRRVSPLINTSKPYKSGRGKLAQHQKRLGDRRNGHSMTLKTLPSNVNPLAFKAPGSMKQHNGG